MSGINPRPVRDDTNLGDLFRRLADDASHLIRTEVKLAKAEVSRNLKATVTPVVLVGMGLVFALAALITFLAALVGWLTPMVGDGWAAFIVAVGAGVIGIVMLLVGKNRLTANELTPSRTIQSLKQDVEVLKGARR